MAQQYNNPPSTDSTIGGEQMNTFHYQKKALIDARREMYFMPMADVTNMPKHKGKRIKAYLYIPLLDDRNINDQGIDANGVTIDGDKYLVKLDSYTTSFAVEGDADDMVAAVNAVSAGVASKGGAGPYVVTVTATILEDATEAQANAIVSAAPLTKLVQNSGNLYGSSKDVGTIVSKLPTLSETGDRVNRVGFTRKTIEGSISKLGFFSDYTADSIQFDSDEERLMHMNRELVNGAVQISEAALQVDLLEGAGVVIYCGDATSDETVDGESVIPAVVDYRTLFNLSLVLDDNRTPKDTKIITGSRMVDTKTIRGGRVLCIGNELQATVEEMKDPFDERAFTHVHQYAAAGTILNGEIGTVAQFRVVVVPEMLSYQGEGAIVDTNPGYRSDAGRYSIYPMLVVGDGSFTTIGFNTSKKGGVKWDMIHKKPGKEIADLSNPYGEVGFHSIKWWYGTLIQRSERLAVVKTLAKE